MTAAAVVPLEPIDTSSCQGDVRTEPVCVKVTPKETSLHGHWPGGGHPPLYRTVVTLPCLVWFHPTKSFELLVSLNHSY